MPWYSAQDSLAALLVGRRMGRMHIVCYLRQGSKALLDLANQFGDAGARRVYEKVSQPGRSEGDLLSAIADESVARVRAQFGDGPETDSTSSRREAFRTTPLLADAPFAPV
jgi:hypothetical protein